MVLKMIFLLPRAKETWSTKTILATHPKPAQVSQIFLLADVIRFYNMQKGKIEYGIGRKASPPSSPRPTLLPFRHPPPLRYGIDFHFYFSTHFLTWLGTTTTMCFFVALKACFIAKIPGFSPFTLLQPFAKSLNFTVSTYHGLCWFAMHYVTELHFDVMLSWILISLWLSFESFCL